MSHKVSNKEELAKVFRNSICPLLDEYFYDHRDWIKEVLNGSDLIASEGHDNWEWKKEAFSNADSYKKIYE